MLVDISGEVRLPSGKPWAYARCRNVLVSGSYDAEAQYPGTETIVTATAAGIVSFRAWANEEGVIASVYRFIYPNGEYFDYTLPAGGAYTLAQIRAFGIGATTPQGESVLAVVETMVDEAVDNVIGASLNAANTALANANIAITDANDALELAGYFRLPFVSDGPPAASGELIRFVAVDAFTLPVDFAGSILLAKVSATAIAVCTAYRIAAGTLAEIAIGTFTFAAGGAVYTPATNVSAAGALFENGDTFLLRGPVVQDTTLSGLHGTLRGNFA